MKTKKLNVTPYPQTQAILKKTNISKYLLGSLAMAAALPLASSSAHADMASTNSVAVTPPPPPASRVNALVDLTLSSHYLTPRGMDVSRQGIVFQPLMLAFFNLYKSDEKDAIINDVTILGGFWNCFGTHQLPATQGNATGNKTGWYETDPIAGISVGFAKNFKVSVTYTAFNMQIYDIPFSQHLETKVSYDDSEYLKAFALHPYFLYWQELDGKAVSNTDPNPSTSHYFDVGITPGYTFKDFYSVRVEAPCRILMAADSFYGTAAGATTFVSLYEIGLKASMPLAFMPSTYGHWGANLGVKYMNFDNPNIEATQHETGSTVVYGGVSVFF